MRRLRLALVGFGVIGQGLAELLVLKRDLLRQEYDLELLLVGVANARHGLIYREDGLAIPTLLELTAQQKPLTDYPGIKHWAQPLEGLRIIGSDILAEVTGTNLRDGGPGLSHIRTALQRGMHVVTANKGPIALAAHELFALAQEHNVQLRAESTVMAGTPVISTIREGMAGARVQSVRGILNGTTNYILSAMASGRDYKEVLAEAQAQGYAEADPTADVEGYDVVAKTLILAALLFDRPLTPAQVQRRGITAISRGDIGQAAREGKRIKLVASLTKRGDGQNLETRVEPIALPEQDLLAHVDGVTNAITAHSDTLGDVTVIGPGAGPLQTGQGLLADILAITKTAF